MLGKNARTILAVALIAMFTPVPVYAELRGGIEIGSRGVKVVVIDVAEPGKIQEPMIRLSESTVTDLVNGLTGPKQEFDPEAINKTTTAITKYLSRLKEEFQIPAERIFTVASSGLVSPVKNDPEKLAATKKGLVTVVQEKCGVTLSFVSPTEEADLSIFGILPVRDHSDGILIDIGGGNTKGGVILEGKPVPFSVPIGVAVSTERLKKEGYRLTADDAKRFRTKELDEALLVPFTKTEGYRSCKKVYLSGGIVWALATLIHPDDNRPFTALRSEDCDELLTRLITNPEAYPVPDLSGIADPAQRDRAKAEIAKVQKVFTAEQLFSGVLILKSLDVAMDWKTGKQVYFVRESQTGWLIAYVSRQQPVR